MQTLGTLVLIMIFTMQAQASFHETAFPKKIETDLASALAQARSEMKQVITSYNHEHQFNLDDELKSGTVENASNTLNETPGLSVMAANLAK